MHLTFVQHVLNMLRIAISPMAMKMLRSVSSVVHHHALGHSISFAGHHTIYLLGNPAFEKREKME